MEISGVCCFDGCVHVKEIKLKEDLFQFIIKYIVQEIDFKIQKGIRLRFILVFHKYVENDTFQLSVLHAL